MMTVRISCFSVYPTRQSPTLRRYPSMPVSFLTLLFGALGSRASAKIFARMRLAIVRSMPVSASLWAVGDQQLRRDRERRRMAGVAAQRAEHLAAGPA